VRTVRSERSRRAILDAALRLFSTQGFRSTSTRDIANAAGISTGALYHHFSDKDVIFQTLLDEYWDATNAPDFPLFAALLNGAFPDDLLALARGARDSVERYRPYIALFYVDIVEFEGVHIQRFYQRLATRFADFLEERPEIAARLRPGVSPLTAAVLVTRVLLYIYSVEHVFGVTHQFGKDEEVVIREIVDILEHGIRPSKK
jgi:AcrR family transcriptional regulator